MNWANEITIDHRLSTIGQKNPNHLSFSPSPTFAQNIFKMKKTTLILSLAWLAFACGNSPEKTEETTETQTEAVDMHNSQTAIDYHGTYRGVLPCADCEGIETEITLGAGDTYTIKSKYLGKSDEVYEQSGSFSWDETGGIAIFNGVNPPNQYRIGENLIMQLDVDGRQVQSELFEKYILRK